YVWVIDAPRDALVARIPLGAAPIDRNAAPFALDFSPDGSRAYIAASGSSSLVAIDCATRQLIARARTGRRPSLARVTRDGRLVLVSDRADSPLMVLGGAALRPLPTVPVACRPEPVAAPSARS